MEKIYFETYGCSLNLADTETMQGILVKDKFQITKDINNADLIIINTCTVKSPTDSAFLKRIKQLPKKPTIIAGCIPQTQPTLKALEGYSLIGTYQLAHISEVVEETLQGNTVVLIAESSEEKENPRLALPKINHKNIIEIIPINTGCLGHCTYCLTKKARGELLSYHPDLIIKRVIQASKNNIKEIWLTSQDTGAYGLDIKTNLPRLLKDLIKIPGTHRIRLGMANPNHIKKYLPELIEIFHSPKMFKFIHIPVQSGNNEVLKKMGRKYKIEDFKHIIQEFKKAHPNITLATDIICGFPGETDLQFQDSIKLVEELKPDVLNISKFWKRPNTPVAKLKQTPGRIIKERSGKLTRTFQWNAFQNNKKWRDWKGKIIIDEKGKNNTSIGRNQHYKQIIVEGNYQLGQEVKIKITKTTIHDLRAIEIK